MIQYFEWGKSGLFATLCVGLVGCGGGGSEDSNTLGGGTGPSTVSLVSWDSSSARNTNVESDAIVFGKQVRSGAMSDQTGSPYTGAQVTFGFDENEQINRIGLVLDDGTEVFTSPLPQSDYVADGDYIEMDWAQPGFAQGPSQGLFSNPQTSGFNYQAFGVAVQRLGGFDRDIYATTFGSVTQSSNVPTGAVSFTGDSAGIYHNITDNESWMVKQDMAATLNLGAGTGSISLSNATVEDPMLNAQSYPPVAGDFDMTMTVNAISGAAGFSGTIDQNAFTNGSGFDNVSTAGSFKGDFYGPSGQEMGGVFEVENGPESFTGAFGGKQ